jgi:sporulation protein YlmC with PRC-barrel domain
LTLIKARVPALANIPSEHQLPIIGGVAMRMCENVSDEARSPRAGRLVRHRPPIVLLTTIAIFGLLTPQFAAAQATLVVVDVVAVAKGFRASKLQGSTIVNQKNEKIGELDDLIVSKDRVLFVIVQVGGFLGIGSRLIAVPYSSLQISDDGKHIVLPGATKEQLKGLPEFTYP